MIPEQPAALMVVFTQPLAYGYLYVKLTTRASGHFEWMGITYLPWTCYKPTMKMDVITTATKNGTAVWTGSSKTKARAAYFKGALQGKSELAAKGLGHCLPGLLTGLLVSINSTES